MSIARVMLGEMSNPFIGNLCHISRIVVRMVPKSLIWSQPQNGALLNPLLDMLSASIRKKDRVRSLDPPGAIRRLAGVEVGPVVVIMHTILVMVGMWLLLEGRSM